ncbi:unnamed protein product [Candidula unifasciata]|uniref:Cytochrome P450 n=1 Tax=Candidula unifasciata TaxID=100452 RepID=A0A8S3ZL24_9EUPU|nr:unnamed protein product [Candidula unifasciata]
MVEILFQSGTSTYLILSVLLALTVYAIFLWLFNKTVKNLPPGPRDWATTWKIMKATKEQTMHELAIEWARRYGPLTFITYLGQKILYLNSADITRQLLASDESKFLLADRPEITPSKLAAYNGKDLVFSKYDAIMKKKRRLFHNVLHLYGDGIEKFENVVSGEMDRLMTELEQFENQDIEFWRYLARSLKIVIYILRTWVPDKPRGIADLLFDIENKPGYQWMEEDSQHAIAFLMSLFWSAHLTSRATVLGVFLCLLNYPAVTKKLQEEIDHIVGDRLPKLEDKSNMPYMEATIIETLRLISQVPACGLRTCSENINFDGMTIPKGTRIMINNWFFHHNEDIFEDPWTFKPERFLDDNGGLLPPDHPLRKSLLPFGIGLRSCPGEIFARSRVFMFVTLILQKYDILPPVNEKLVLADFQANHEDARGFIRQVQPYKCRLQRRQRTG